MSAAKTEQASEDAASPAQSPSGGRKGRSGTKGPGKSVSEPWEGGERRSDYEDRRYGPRTRRKKG